MTRDLQVGAEWLSVQDGGLNRYTEGLARALASGGTPHRWLALGDPSVGSGSGLEVNAVASPRDGLIKRWSALRHAFDTTSPPPRHVATHFALYAFPLRRSLRKVPHTVHFHGPWADESRAEGARATTVWLKRRLEQRVYRTADRFITLSQAFARVLSERYRVNPDRVRVVPGGIDVDRFDLGISRETARERLGWPTDRPIVLCVRRLVRRVGLENLLEAMASVRSSCPDALLLIAGKGPLADQLAQEVQGRGLSQSVRMLGFVPEEDLPTAYRAADLSVVPSQSLEGFGLIIPEALASGTPALVTPVGGMPEVVYDLDPALVVSSSSAGAIATGLAEALTGRSTLPTAEACRAYARQRFAWPTVAEQVLAVYREAIDAHG